MNHCGDRALEDDLGAGIPVPRPISAPTNAASEHHVANHADAERRTEPGANAPRRSSPVWSWTCPRPGPSARRRACARLLAMNDGLVLRQVQVDVFVGHALEPAAERLAADQPHYTLGARRQPTSASRVAARRSAGRAKREWSRSHSCAVPASASIPTASPSQDRIDTSGPMIGHRRGGSRERNLEESLRTEGFQGGEPRELNGRQAGETPSSPRPRT